MSSGREGHRDEQALQVLRQQVLQDRYADAIAFLGKIRMETTTAEALLAGLVDKVETSTDDSRKVPTQVKKQWQRWNLDEHPDKGGSTEVYNTRKEEYTSFKETFGEWLDANPTGQLNFQTWCRKTDASAKARNSTRLKALLKEIGEEALLAAKKALEEGRRNDAKVEADRAVNNLEEFQALQATKLGGKEIREMIAQARDVEAAVRQCEEEEARRLEEEERKQQELKEAKEAMTSFDGLWQFMSASITESGLDWARKAAHLQELFKEGKGEIDELRREIHELRKRDEEHHETSIRQQQALDQAKQEAELSTQKYAAELKKVGDSLQSVSGERDMLKREQREELELFDRAYAGKKSEGPGWSWISSIFGDSSEKKSKKQRTQAIVDQLDRQEVELQDSARTLERTRVELQEREALLKKAEQCAKASKERESKLRAELDAASGKAEEDCKQLLQNIDDAFEKLKLEEAETKRLGEQRAAVEAILHCELLPSVVECVEEANRCLLDLQHKSSEIKVKVKRCRDSEEDNRILPVSRECHDMFEDLRRTASERFGLANDGLFFKYKDGEKDEITVKCSADLTEAISQFPSSLPKLLLCTPEDNTSNAVLQQRAPTADAAKGGGVDEAPPEEGGANAGALDER